jgi:hypothetical protein
MQKKKSKKNLYSGNKKENDEFVHAKRRHIIELRN